MPVTSRTAFHYTVYAHPNETPDRAPDVVIFDELIGRRCHTILDGALVIDNTPTNVEKTWAAGQWGRLSIHPVEIETRDGEKLTEDEFLAVLGNMNNYRSCVRFADPKDAEDS